VKVDYVLGQIASSQAGLLGHDQVIARGLSERGIRHRVQSNAWLPAGRGLYRVNGVDGDYRGYLRAAIAILPGATVSHESAAELRAIPSVQRGKAVVTVHARTTHVFPGVRIHRSLDLADHHRSVLGGLPVTTAARTIVDLAAFLRRQHMAHVIDESLAARIVAIDELQALFDEVARRGRTGSALMRSLLGERTGFDHVTATTLERVGMKTFVAGGLPRPEFQYPAPWDPTRAIDFAWPSYRLGCECDSRRWHTRVNDFQTDRTRDNLSLDHNWRIYRYTWQDFKERPQMIVFQLRRAMAA
jgi:hypothetical protein